MAALYIIPILAILILIHEFGHFITAKLVGIRVEEFGIGLPPRAFGIKRGGVIYSINCLPIGGFVRVLGEDGKSHAPDSLQSKSRGRRALFFGAGSLMNLLLAFALITVLVAARGDSITHAYIATVEPDSPAAQAGWQVGDRLISVGGESVSGVDQMVGAINQHGGQPIPVTIQRGDQTIQTTVVPRVNPPAGQGRTGIQVVEAPEATVTVDSVADGSPAAAAGLMAGDRLVAVEGRPIIDGETFVLTVRDNAGGTIPLTVRRGGSQVSLQLAVPQASSTDSTSVSDTPAIGLNLSQSVVTKPVTWWKIIPRGVGETFGTLHLMVSGVISLFQGGGAALGGIAGPIGMGQLTSEMLKVSPQPAWVTLTNITALLSLNLALLNLIPFPALDGGRLFFVLIEMIRGKKVPPEKEGVVHFVGLVVLLTFMLVVAYFDINRLVTGQPFIR